MIYRPDVCLSIGGLTFDDACAIADDKMLTEVRMDLLNFSDKEFCYLFAKGQNFIASSRKPMNNAKEMVHDLNLAMNCGCKIIDIDINTPEHIRNQLINTMHSKSGKVILSYHNFESTPDQPYLQETINKMFDNGADFAKIACLANSPKDCASILSLYAANNHIIAISMGEIGKITRLAAPILGAPFTYASLPLHSTATGQLSYKETCEFLNTVFPFTSQTSHSPYDL